MNKQDVIYTAEIAHFLSDGWVIVPDNNLCGINVTRIKLERDNDRVVITRGNKGYTVAYSDQQLNDKIVKFEEDIV